MTNEFVSKWMKMQELLLIVRDELVLKFFDVESDTMMDEKIEVLENLAAGTPPNEIPNYYKVLELYPEDGAIWD